MMDVLTDINRNDRITMVIVTHEHDISARTQKTVRISDGTITEMVQN
jgi:predicted ABC-type transport system involved in lysophospholipase L1 biosynthesis ATPase subunit